ncbi:hypothetical protein DFH09DRAFT_1276090 [Mycena vulgaris]|nr:hypothetical protein DFH09DRAFT_1276090 [Mycena vulgaris]
MPRPSALLLGTLPVALLGILYYEHRRLQSSYPTLRVPPYFEISARRDRPAFGMSGANDGEKSRPGDPWMNTYAGDITAFRRHLNSVSVDDRIGLFYKPKQRSVEHIAHLYEVFGCQIKGNEQILSPFSRYHQPQGKFRRSRNAVHVDRDHPAPAPFLTL